MLKCFRCFLALLCVMTIVFALLPPAQAAEPTGYGYGLLKNDQQRTAYKALEAGISQLSTQIEFTAKGINGTDLQMALDMVLEDHPEIFWFNGAGGFSLLNTGKVTFYPDGYSVDGVAVNSSNIGSYKQKLENAVTNALKGLPNDSDYEKALYLHDYICKLVEYKSGEDDQTAYGSLVEGKAVCAGYARAFQLLLQRIGIKSWYVTGWGINPSSGQQEAHGWNIVFLNNKCFYTDVTWNDRGTEIFHSFFMISLEHISETHVTAHPEYIPSSCGHSDMDYFVVHAGNGTGIFHGYESASTIAGWMREVSPGEWVCEIEVLSGNLITWMSQNFSTVANTLNLTGERKYTISYVDNEYHVRITGTPGHKHSNPLRKVSKVSASCTKSGNIEYYLCDSCGDYFYDSAAKSKISNKQSVVIAAKGHTYTAGQWYANSAQHWQKCKDCGYEKPGSRGSHMDYNMDAKCDTCGGKVEVQILPTNPGTTPTNPGTTPTNPGTTPTNSGTTPTNPGVVPTNPGVLPTNPPTNPGVLPTNPGNNTEHNPGGNTEYNPGGNTEFNPGASTATKPTGTQNSGTATKATRGDDSSDKDHDEEDNVSNVELILTGTMVAPVALIIIVIIIAKRKK